jgi:hypothetical protein
VLRTSSPSLMVASIMAGRVAYGDKGDLSVLSEKVHNVSLPEDGVEGAVVEDPSKAWSRHVLIDGSAGCHNRHGHLSS